jgi:hypothetical protein
MSIQTPQKTAAIILNCSNDWDEWLEVVKTKAIGGKVWKFVDPSVSKDELPVLMEPTLPLPEDINPDKTTIAELTEPERMELKDRRRTHKRQQDLYDKQEAALTALRTTIQETISRAYLRYTFKCDSTYDMLTTLKRRVAPTDRARKIELINRYEKLRKAPQSQNLETWLRQWEITYTECKELKLAEVDDDRPLYDFLNAITSVDAEFSKIWMIKIETRTQKGKELPDIHELIEYFRNNRRLSTAQKEHDEHDEHDTYGVFKASFQGESLEEEKQDLRKKNNCVCGEEHLFKECQYLIESVRTKDWKPDPTIQKQIDDKLEKYAKLKGIVKRVQTEQQKKAKKS